MEVFCKDGHLNDAALIALIQDNEIDQLSRLEIAEHLAYCDLCLQRYTDLLANTELLAMQSCRESLRSQLHQRTIRLLTSRYAIAAAAVVLALTLLWGNAFLTLSPNFIREEAKKYLRTVKLLPDHWNTLLERFFRKSSGVLRSVYRTLPYV